MVEHSRTTQSFLDSIDLRYGPRELLTRFLLKAVDAVEKRGITLEVGTFKQLLEINEQNSDSWMPLTTTFRWDVGGVDDRTGVVFVGRNAQGEPVAAQGARHFNWQQTNFKEEAESLRFYYADPERQKAPEETCIVTAPPATEIHGSVGLSGALWFRPDYRRLMLPAILPRIARAYALTTWDIETMITIITKVNVERGLHKKNGFRDISWDVKMYRSPTYPDGVLDVGLARMTAVDLVDDLFRFIMEFDAELDVGIAARHA